MNERVRTRKRPWQRPELIVLVRSKPEEAVLTACKYLGYMTGGPGYVECWDGAPDYCFIASTS
jgi:hypothetical protein